MNKDTPISRVGGQRAIMALLDLLGRRWTLRVLWELRNAPLTSRALRNAAGEISPTVLQSRVNALREARIIELGKQGYELTPLGKELQQAFEPLYRFADRWAQAVTTGAPTDSAD